MHWNLNRNIFLDIVLKGYLTTQTRSPLQTAHDLNWAYALRLRKQFFIIVIEKQRLIKYNAVLK